MSYWYSQTVSVSDPIGPAVRSTCREPAVLNGTDRRMFREAMDVERVGCDTSSAVCARLVCAALATLLAAASHVLAGGNVPFLAVALSVSVGALVCVVLAGRRLTLPRAASGVAVSQLAFLRGTDMTVLVMVPLLLAL